MAYHVEISSSFRRARQFNLDQDELERKIVRPWVEGRPIRFGERDWEPGKSSLKVLKGRRLEAPDLAFGQGWSNAERLGENVTRSLVDEAVRNAKATEPEALVIESDDPAGTLADLTAGLDARQVKWAQAREWIDGRDPRVAAVVLVLRSDPQTEAGTAGGSDS